MSYDFNEHLKSTILEINYSNRMKMLAQEAEHQKELEEMQHQATEDDDLVEREALDFND